MKKLLPVLLIAIFSINAYSQKDTTIQNISTVIGKSPVDSGILIVINGNVVGTIRELKTDIRNAIPVDIIESIDVLKGFKATDKYGEKGKAGVIEFYLKNTVKIEELNLVDKKIPEDDAVFKKVEVEAAFPGGDRIWRTYLEKNLHAEVPGENYAPSGTYTIIVQFIVDKSGNISEVKSLTTHGFGMEEEVIRVISKGPKWTPAIQDGKPVKAYRKQPVTFMVMNDIELSTYTIPAGKPTSIEIVIDRSDIEPEDLEVSLSSGTIVHNSGKKYTITADKAGQILLSVKKKAKKKKDEASFGPVAIQVK